jgi:hypothetical protein
LNALNQCATSVVTLDEAYNASSGASSITVDAGDVSWNLTGAYSFNVDLTAVTGTSDGFQVNNGTNYWHVLRSAANLIIVNATLDEYNMYASVLNLDGKGVTIDAINGLSLDSAESSNFSLTANDAVDQTLTISVTNIGAGTGILDVAADGTISVNSSGGVLNFGSNADAFAINIGTGAAARTITIGNVTTTTAIVCNTGSGGLEVNQIGTIKTESDILTLTNKANAVDMDGTGVSVLFNLWYNDAHPAVADAGRVSVVAETDWTSTVSTQDSYMSLSTALDGTVAERWRINSAGNLSDTGAAGTAYLHLKAGTAAAGTAPLKFTSGVLLGTPEAGAFEFDGSYLYYTDSTPARHQLATGDMGWVYAQNVDVDTGTEAVDSFVVSATSGWYFAGSCFWIFFAMNNAGVPVGGYISGSFDETNINVVYNDPAATQPVFSIDVTDNMDDTYTIVLNATVTTDNWNVQVYRAPYMLGQIALV